MTSRRLLALLSTGLLFCGGCRSAKEERCARLAATIESQVFSFARQQSREIEASSKTASKQDQSFLRERKKKLDKLLSLKPRQRTQRRRLLTRVCTKQIGYTDLGCLEQMTQLKKGSPNCMSIAGFVKRLSDAVAKE